MATIEILGVVHPDDKRDDSLVRLVVRADSLEKEIKVKTSARENTSGLKMELDTIVRDQVALSMEKYKIEVQGIPSGVKQHDLLTRIIVNGEYTADDRAAVRELVRQRQAL